MTPIDAFLSISFDQVWLGAFGVTAIALSQDSRERARRWAPIFGLISQPAWLYTSIEHGQFAIAALTLFYTWAWFKGVRTYWMKGR
jgi:hypothetical protein